MVEHIGAAHLINIGAVSFASFFQESPVARAQRYVREHLDIQASLVRFNGDSSAIARTLVLRIWTSIPGLAEQKPPPMPCLIGAAALAAEVESLDLQAAGQSSDAMKRALRTLLQTEVYKLARPAEMGPMDILLWELAHGAMGMPGASPDGS